MTEYETIAPEISENITLIGNQQETKRETRLMKLSNTAHGLLSHYDTGSYSANSYYKTTISNYLRENWYGFRDNRNRLNRGYEKETWHKRGKELSYAVSFIKANARSSNLDSGTKFAMMLSYQIDIANAYMNLITTGIYGLSVLKTKNLEMRRKYNTFAEIGYPTISEYAEVLDTKRKQDWRELDWSELSQGTSYSYEDNKIAIGRISNLTLLHQSLTKEGSVAYYRDLADMKRGREIVTTFGKYLARFRDFLGLNEKQIKELADNYLTQHAGFNDLTLHYIDGKCDNNQESVDEQQDKWFNAYHEDNQSDRYERCHSCMTNKVAIKVYANPKSVLKLAVLKDEQEYIHGRCIVRDDEHKGYIRVYPHASESKLGNFLKQKLSADGYTDRVNLNGVYLDGKWLSSYDCYRVPYIDGQSHDVLGEKWVYAVEKTINDRDYLHIESEYETDHYLENTNGRSYQDGDEDEEDDNYTYCEHCDNSIHEDDVHYIEEERLCSSCYDDVAVEVITCRLDLKNHTINGVHSEQSRDDNGLPIYEGRTFPEDAHKDSSNVFKIVDSYKDESYVRIDSVLDDKQFDLYMNVMGYVRPLFMNPRFDSLQDPFINYFSDDDFEYHTNEYSTRFNGLKYWTKSHDLLSTEFGWVMTEKTYKIFLDLDYSIRRPKIFVGEEYNKVCKKLGVKNILPTDFVKVTFNTYVTPDDILVTLPTDKSQYLYRGKPRKITHVHKTRVKTLPDGTTCQIDNPDFIYLP